MSEILKNLKWNMVVTAVLVIILGLILILYPGIAVATICLIVGWGLFIGGVVSVYCIWSDIAGGLSLAN